MATALLTSLSRDAHHEARALLAWWMTALPDGDGGFHGEIDLSGKPVPGAPLSALLMTRLLWFFSAAGSHLGDAGALHMADRAAVHVRRCFLTALGDGVHWLADQGGSVIDDHRATIAHASAIHAFAQHYVATCNPDSLATARRLQAAAERRAWDAGREGYWDRLGNGRSGKDLGACLHLMEAYTVLHRVAPDGASQAALERALTIFLKRFATGGPVAAGYDGDWMPWPATVSYGHDAEAGWLIWEAARVHGGADMVEQSARISLGLAERTRLAVRTFGRIPFSRDADGVVDRDGEWWGQAEGLVALVSAWQLSGDRDYLHAAEQLWAYVNSHHGAGSGTEWSWYATGSAKPSPCLAGAWKCPYHTGRAMIELDRRLGMASPAANHEQ